MFLFIVLLSVSLPLLSRFLSFFFFFQVQDCDIEPMLGPSETEGKMTYFLDGVGREFGRADDETMKFWDRVEKDYMGP